MPLSWREGPALEERHDDHYDYDDDDDEVNDDDDDYDDDFNDNDDGYDDDEMMPLVFMMRVKEPICRTCHD